MATHKYIYWRPDLQDTDNGLVTCNVHLLVGYTAETIPAYMKMVKELQKTFPQAKIEDIQIGRVTKSSFCQGFSIITWTTQLPKQEYPGWYSHETGRMEYYW